jgi:RNA polymerase sigma-70 factor (ECF subfamily)
VDSHAGSRGSSQDCGTQTVLARIAGGESAAMAELYDATNRRIFGLILRILRQHEASEDVLVEVYAQAWRQAATYDPERGSALAWLLKIARSRAIDALRARAREPVLSPIEDAQSVPDSTADPEGATSEAERRGIVRAALVQLVRDQREAIELAYFRGMSHSEIAARLGEPLGTIKTRIRLGMQRLRESLAILEAPNVSAATGKGA